jgi:hypothetical protein
MLLHEIIFFLTDKYSSFLILNGLAYAYYENNSNHLFTIKSVLIKVTLYSNETNF